MTTQQTSADKTRALLRKVKAHWLNAAPGPDAARKSTLEFYAIPNQGTLIVQYWDDGSTSTYADWPLPQQWDAFEASLTGYEHAPEHR
jgi:hypothetical protein